MEPRKHENKIVHVIRSARQEDLSQVRDIFGFYVRNTTISFMLDEPPLEYMIRKFKSTIDRNLPYLVAVDADDQARVLGFCHASPFSSDKGGYAGAVDFSLFVRPEDTRQGIGAALLEALIAHLQEQPFYCWEHDGASRFEVRAKQLYAISSADLVNRGGWEASGEVNWEWYRCKFGFKEVARLPGIGSKFGQRYVCNYYLQDPVHIQTVAVN